MKGACANGSGGNSPSMGPREKFSLFGPYRLQWGARR